jgi:hypothetical protein
LSQPTLRRQTPIAKTVLHFMVRLDSEGAMTLRLSA